MFFVMIDRTKIEKLVKEYMEGKDLFLVDVRVTRDNKITVVADTPSDITIDQCAELSRFIESRLDRNEEDYELEVSSPGIGHPFIVKEQYLKNIGKSVEVVCLTGEKYRGILKNVTGNGVEIESQEGKKSKSRGLTDESKNISINFEEIKSTKEILIFR